MVNKTADVSLALFHGPVSQYSYPSAQSLEGGEVLRDGADSRHGFDVRRLCAACARLVLVKRQAASHGKLGSRNTHSFCRYYIPRSTKSGPHHLQQHPMCEISRSKIPDIGKPVRSTLPRLAPISLIWDMARHQHGQAEGKLTTGRWRLSLINAHHRILACKSRDGGEGLPATVAGRAGWSNPQAIPHLPLLAWAGAARNAPNPAPARHSRTQV